MSTLFPKTIEYENGVGDYDETTGKWVNGTKSTLSFQGSVQPITGKEIKSFPWARQDTGHVKVYSSTPLVVSIEGGDNPGDVVLWKGQKWEVVYEMKNQNDLINHYKYIAEYRSEIV